jgi:uncharacterized damage-inducible protein DinB
MTSQNSESIRIADQLRRAFEGDAWHGPALLELLKDVNAATAAARPMPDAHNIWELVLHVAVWDRATLRRLAGERTQPTGLDNFPLVPAPAGERAWNKAVSDLRRTHQTLVKTVAALPEPRLWERVPGKRYNFYHLLHGVAQHELYHAGQIAILKKMKKIG